MLGISLRYRNWNTNDINHTHVDNPWGHSQENIEGVQQNLQMSMYEFVGRPMISIHHLGLIVDSQ